MFFKNSNMMFLVGLGFMNEKIDIRYHVIENFSISNVPSQIHNRKCEVFKTGRQNHPLPALSIQCCDWVMLTDGARLAF